MAIQERRLLESWKEISAYLKKSERSCRRFEATLDLPVHRLDGTPRARVFAYTDELDQWLQGTLNHAQEEALKKEDARGRRRVALVASAAFVCALCVAAVLYWLPFLPAPAPVFPRNPSLAVLPFDNPGNDPGLEPWRTMLADLVITDLIQSRYVNVLRVTDLLRQLVELKLGEAASFSDDDLRAVARKAGVDYVATGSLSSGNGRIVAEVRVRDPQAEPAPPPLRTAFNDESGVFSAADRISRGIKFALKLTRRHVARDIDRDVAGISTPSPQAFRLFSQGYRMAGLGKYSESIAILKSAVAEDPGFALAHKYLSRACQNEDRREDETAHIRKAIDFSDRLSVRERGELEVLFYRSYEVDSAHEIRALEGLVRSYPGDRFAAVLYGGLLLDREEWAKALPVVERAWLANRNDINLCRQLMWCYLNTSQGEEAESTLEDLVASNPGPPSWAEAMLARTRCLRLLGKYDRARADVDKLIARYPNRGSLLLERGLVGVWAGDLVAAERDIRSYGENKDPFIRIEAARMLSDVRLLQGRLGEAAQEIRQAMEIAGALSKDDRGGAAARSSLHADLANIHRLAGRPGEAFAEIEEAHASAEGPPRGSSPSLGLLRQEALVLLDLGRQQEFDGLMEGIRKLIEARNHPRLMRVYFHLLGQSELKRGDLEKAVDLFSRAVDLTSFPGGPPGGGADPESLYSLAVARERLDRRRGALVNTIYEKVLAPSIDRIHSRDLYARSLYETARSYEARASEARLTVAETSAMNAKAVQRYRAFLDLWAGADTLFAPLVEDARKRLAALEAQ